MRIYLAEIAGSVNPSRGTRPADAEREPWRARLSRPADRGAAPQARGRSGVFAFARPLYARCDRKGRRVRRLTAVLGAIAGLAGAGAAEAAGPSPLLADCAACHGDEGVAKDVETPNLAGQRETYLYNQLLAFHRGKRPHKEMRLMSRHMTEAEMRAIAQYYAALPPR